MHVWRSEHSLGESVLHFQIHLSGLSIMLTSEMNMATAPENDPRWINTQKQIYRIFKKLFDSGYGGIYLCFKLRQEDFLFKDSQDYITISYIKIIQILYKGTYVLSSAHIMALE